MRALLVDDNEDFAFALGRILRAHDIETFHASDGRTALEFFRQSSWDVVLLDVGLPDADGLEILGRLLEEDAACPVVVLTGRDDAKLAVQALKAGAQNYLTKPIGRDELLSVVDQVLSPTRSRRRLETTVEAAQEPLGSSPLWRRTVRQLVAAASSPRTPVLLRGESGTGKEVAASFLHCRSDRATGPFVTVNAGCFSPSLLESELFGHEAGAFTGARGTKRGLFELAHGGTLFLDEVGELPLELQPKLLRILEGHPFRRVGGEKELRVNVRVLSATHRDIPRLVENGQFRLDLYHRLRVMEIELPALRERGNDVEELAWHFLATLGPQFGKLSLTLQEEARRALSAYHWPGNVRELRNALECAVVLCQGNELRLRDLPKELQVLEHHAVTEPHSRAEVVFAGSGLRLLAPVTLEAVTRQHVLTTFQASQENLTRAAQTLGISRMALRRKLKAYGAKP